jgi:hypothetical protein
VFLHLRNGDLAEVENTRGQYSIGTGRDSGWAVLGRACATAGNDRHVDRCAD